MNRRLTVAACCCVFALGALSSCSENRETCDYYTECAEGEVCLYDEGVNTCMHAASCQPAQDNGFMVCTPGQTQCASDSTRYVCDQKSEVSGCYTWNRSEEACPDDGGCFGTLASTEPVAEPRAADGECRAVCAEDATCGADTCQLHPGHSAMTCDTPSGGISADTSCILVVESAEIGGRDWDPVGFPDPYVHMRLATYSGNTGYYENTNSPVWNEEYGPYPYAEFSNMNLAIYDSDEQVFAEFSNNDDFIAEWTGEGGRWFMGDQRTRQFVLSQDPHSLTVTIRCQ